MARVDARRVDAAVSRTSNVNVAEFVGRLAARTHPERAAAWDAVGLQVGDPRSPVRTTTVVHEVTEAVTERSRRRTRRPRRVLPPAAVPPGIAAGGRPQPGRAGHSPGPCRSRRRRDAQRLRRHARRDVRRDGRRPRPGGRRWVRSDGRRRPGQGRHVRPGRLGDQHHRQACSPPEPVGSATTSECAFTVDGVGRFTAEATTTPSVGQAGRRNVEAEIRVEMIAPARRTDAVVEALIATHPYEEPAFDIYPVASNHTLGGRLGTFAGGWDDLVGAGRRRLPARWICASVGPPTTSATSRRGLPRRRRVTDRRGGRGGLRRPRQRRHLPPPDGRGHRPGPLDHRRRTCAERAPRDASARRARRRDRRERRNSR